jgi:DNA-binding transcriptional regulator YiaG
MRGHLIAAEGTAKTFRCPNCDSSDVKTTLETDRFDYGIGQDATTLEAEIPLRTCASCGFEYTDSEAEDIRHEVVCRHLGLLTPSEIEAIRNHFGPTRAEFASRSRIGEASLARWEAGQIFQNAANDNYIYLLAFMENWQRLQARGPGLPSEFRRESRSAARVSVRRFRSLDEDSVAPLRRQGRDFLRSAVG